MSKKKWFGTWVWKEPIQNEQKRIDINIEVGIIPSVLFVGTVIYLIFKLI
ncbi:hypothetical protein [Allofustis seminis]|nr:hypothetical protein [Allofustis seminis]